MKVPNGVMALLGNALSLSRLQNEGSQLWQGPEVDPFKSIKATE